VHQLAGRDRDGHQRLLDPVPPNIGGIETGSVRAGECLARNSKSGTKPNVTLEKTGCQGRSTSRPLVQRMRHQVSNWMEPIMRCELDC
jgi:hypothetical protein